MRTILLVLAAAFLMPSALSAQERDPAVILAEAGPGARWGFVVADEYGREIVAIRPEERFVPASNTKVFTTAAAMRAVARGALPEAGNGGARVRLEKAERGGSPTVILEGRGDARLSSAKDCLTNCLSILADAVASRMRKVGDVVGDATWFPDERWGPGMSWNNIPTRSGTGVGALVLDENEVAAIVTPGPIGAAPAVAMPDYFAIDNRAVTVAGDRADLVFTREPHGRTIVLTGTIGADAPPETLQLGIDDPAHYAAARLAGMLRARGVKVKGQVLSRYRPLAASDDPAKRSGAAIEKGPDKPALAVVVPGPLADDVRTVNKVSQNLRAELLLRRIGRVRGSGSIADGQAEVRAMLIEAGVGERMVSLSDGSGMSSYNRVAPRGMVRLLGWIARQPWGAAFRDTLPVGGVDGTLARRFTGTPLAGKIFAKTGTLNGTNALAGWLTAASGRTLAFAIYANDVPEGVRATSFMDRALIALAAAH